MRALAAVLLAVAAASAAAVTLALLAWPSARLVPDADGLARVQLPGFAGRVVSVEAGAVPVRLRGGRIWPVRAVDAGERLTVTVTVRRPGWAAWLVGGTERRSLTIVTPVAHLLGRWLQVKPGAAVAVGFDRPVARISVDGTPRSLATPAARVAVAPPTESTGSVRVAASARSWERLPPPVRVSWFPARPYAQVLVRPRPGGAIGPLHELALTFSQPVAAVLGGRRPQLSPAAPGSWRQTDAHTLVFRPSQLGFGLGGQVGLELPRAVHVAGTRGAALTRELGWQVPPGSTLRLQQLLARLGYLPLDWQPLDPPGASARAELAAALTPPRGRFSWRYPHTPPELRALWHPGRYGQITRGAVMSFQHDQGLAVDAIPGRRVWRALIAAVLAGKRRPGGYSYVFVHRSVPQSLNLWHDGRVILSSPGNTGVPAAPTQLGTYQVFEHIPVGTMSGRNPDGSRYHDPGIRWISYFHHGEAIHAFTRASFGTPQSLGCVELPLAAAAKVWPYTPIGTLVTIEN